MLRVEVDFLEESISIVEKESNEAFLQIQGINVKDFVTSEASVSLKQSRNDQRVILGNFGAVNSQLRVDYFKILCN